MNLLYNYCSNIISRNIYDLSLNWDSLWKIVYCFVASNHIVDFNDAIIQASIPIINEVGLRAVSCDWRIEFIWSCIKLINSIKNNDEVTQIVKAINLKQHIEELRNTKYNGRLTIKHVRYFGLIEDYYASLLNI